MFSKIAFRNVKKSLRDYVVYFLTLALGVCIFYVFNSIDAQVTMMDITESGGMTARTTVSVIGIISVFIAVVLAFLIVYANKFMIRRRKKELGIYLTLGMPQSKISAMLVLETLLIGAMALGAGLLLGIFLSQGLAVVTAKLFQVNIVNFHFVFSRNAFYKSILYFGVIFLVVMLFNSASISKYRLIDLLYADRKNETLRLRKTGPSIALFILGAALIGFSYYIAARGGAGMILFTLGPALAVCGAGTLLLFMSLSGFLLKSVQSNKNVYFKGLNMFVARQLASRVNTNFVSMTFICVMLGLTIVILSTITSFNAAFNRDTDMLTPYDISFTIGESEGGAHTTVEECLPKLGVDADALFSEKHEYSIYQTDARMAEIAAPNTAYLTDEAAKRLVEESTLQAVKLSDYNALMALQGKEGVSLGESEFAVVSVEEPLFVAIGEYLRNPRPIAVNGTALLPAPLPVQKSALWTSQNGYMDMLIVLPDARAEGLNPVLDVYAANFASPKAADAFLGTDAAIDSFKQTSGIQVRMADRAGVRQATAGLTASLIFVGIYMGLVFLIAAAAVLALQQLSEAADSKKRYDLLKDLGAEEKMIDASIFTQVGLYFLIPLALALVHSVVGIRIMNQGIMAFGQVNILGSAVWAALLLALVYGGYFLATCFGCRNIIHAKTRR